MVTSMMTVGLVIGMRKVGVVTVMRKKRGYKYDDARFGYWND